MKKFSYFLTLVSVLLIFLSSGISVNAAEILPYWYSDTSEIRSFNSSSYSISVIPRESITGMPEETIAAYSIHALNAWTNALGSSSLSWTVDHVNPDMVITDITRAEADSGNIPDNVLALGTMTGTKNLYYQAYYDGNLKLFYHYPNSIVYLIWDDTSSAYVDKAWQEITTHEVGHAIGHYGHNPDSTQLMYYSVNPSDGSYNTTPQSKDTSHMHLVY